MPISFKCSSPVSKSRKVTTYPALGCIPSINLVVLFDNPARGMVVKTGIDYRIGEYSTVWNMMEFEPYVGTLTIESTND